MKNKKKLFLYILFSIIIIVSGVIFIIDMNRKNDVPEMYEPTPSEISNDESEKINTKIEGVTIKFAPDVDLNEERKKHNNNDIIGRLEIPDLFNVLVVKGTDNSFYLHHDINKKTDKRGTEFLDYHINPTSKQVNIYGHNSRDPNVQVAFLKLEKFLDSNYFDDNPYIALQYDGGKSIYKINSMTEIKETNVEHLYLDYTGTQFVDHMNKITSGERVIFTRNLPINENSEVLILQTCSHHWSNALYLITAVKINY